MLARTPTYAALDRPDSPWGVRAPCSATSGASPPFDERDWRASGSPRGAHQLRGVGPPKGGSRFPEPGSGFGGLDPGAPHSAYPDREGSLSSQAALEGVSVGSDIEQVLREVRSSRSVDDVGHLGVHDRGPGASDRRVVRPVNIDWSTLSLLCSMSAAAGSLITSWIIG